MDKLEILPNDQILTEHFIEEGSPEEIESGVNSMYQRLQSSYMYNLRMWTLDIVAGEGRVGNEAGGNGLETTQLSNFTATSDNSGAKELWRGPWAGISRTNWILTDILFGLINSLIRVHPCMFRTMYYIVIKILAPKVFMYLRILGLKRISGKYAGMTIGLIWQGTFP